MEKQKTNETTDEAQLEPMTGIWGLQSLTLMNNNPSRLFALGCATVGGSSSAHTVLCRRCLYSNAFLCVTQHFAVQQQFAI